LPGRHLERGAAVILIGTNGWENFTLVGVRRLGYDVPRTAPACPGQQAAGESFGDAMPQTHVREDCGPTDEARLQSLVDVIDLLGRHTKVRGFLPELAACLRTFSEFDVLGVVVPGDRWSTAQLYAVRVQSADAASARTKVHSIDVPPLDRARLAALADTGAPAMVSDRLDEADEFAGVIAALRGLGQQSACLLPLSTVLGPAGLMILASSRDGTYRNYDLSFLRRIGALLAMAIDAGRRQQEAVAHAHELQAERDHRRTLLEVTNAVVTQRDVAALRAAVVPNVRRIVPHDHTNLYLVDEQRRVGPFVIDPTALPWPDDLATQIQLDAEPYKSWLTPFDRAVDVDVTHADPKGWEAMKAHVEASGVKRICNAPPPSKRSGAGSAARARCLRQAGL